MAHLETKYKVYSLLVIAAILGYIQIAVGDQIRSGLVIVGYLILFAVSVTVVLLTALGCRTFLTRWIKQETEAVKYRAEADKVRAEADQEKTKVLAIRQAIPHYIRQLERGNVFPDKFLGLENKTFPTEQLKQFILPEPESPVRLPELVRIEDMIDPDNVSLRSLILGVGDQQEIVRGGLYDLSHIGVAGTSRWGKSEFFRMLLYQILLAREETALYLSDISGNTFIDFGLPFADSVASSEKMAMAVLETMAERKEAFQRTSHRAKSLEAYNAMTGQNLPHIIFAADETTVLMDQSSRLTSTIKEIVTFAGKYGVSMILASQHWGGRSVPTVIRDQFAARFQFKAMDRYQADILIKNSGAEEFQNKGRATAYIPERGCNVLLQSPLVSGATIETAVATRTRPLVDDLQWIVASESEPDETDIETKQRIISLYDNGLSATKISEEVYGYKNKSKLDYIRKVLQEAGRLKPGDSD